MIGMRFGVQVFWLAMCNRPCTTSLGSCVLVFLCKQACMHAYMLIECNVDVLVS